MLLEAALPLPVLSLSMLVHVEHVAVRRAVRSCACFGPRVECGATGFEQQLRVLASA